MDWMADKTHGDSPRRTEREANLPEPLLSHLQQVGRAVSLKAGAKVTRSATATEELYHFVMEGHLVVVLDASEPSSESGGSAGGGSAGGGSAGRTTREHISYFGPGDFFSDGYLTLPDERARGPRVECIAETATKLLVLPRSDLERFLAANASCASLLSQRNTSLRLHYLKHRLPEGRLVQDFFLRHHYLNAGKARVVQLDSCIGCNGCVSACAARHGGIARTLRTGVQLGRVVFRAGCSSCLDPRCIAVCKAQALRRDPVSQEIVVDEWCTGCGACAKICPNHAVTMRDAPLTASDFQTPIPKVDSNGATNVDGVYVIGGRASGRSMRNPKAGVLAVARIAARSGAQGRGGKADTVPDVIIVGAGSAGLSAAEECRSRDLRCVVIEKGTAVLQGPTASSWSKLVSGEICSLYVGERAVRVARSGTDGLEVTTTERMLRTRAVLVATGVNDGLDLLEGAGVSLLVPGSPEMQEHIAKLGARRQAIKCDGCAAYDDEACLTACPTGALVEISPVELFFSGDSASRSSDPPERADFTAVPFVDGIEEHRRRRAHGFPWLGMTTLLITIAMGIECFLRRTMPETSLTSHWLRSRGMPGATDFVSSRELGHELGYVGTALMLMTLLYSLRSRFDWFSWISKRTFLSLHIWMGIAGAAFVSYHSLLKLDRWVAIAMWGTWLVILTGVVGRYVYGWIHSQVGVTEAELKAIAMQQRDVGMGLALGANGLPTDLWTGLDENEIKVSRNVFVGLFEMVWLDARERLRLWHLRLFGSKHIADRNLRRQIVRLVGERASGARRKRYWDQAERLLAWWNGVHIVVAIAMFIVAAVHIVYSIVYTGY